MPDHIDFTDNNTKEHSTPEIYRDPRQRDILEYAAVQICLIQ